MRCEISVRRPDDFDEHWDGLLAEVAALPLDPTLTYSELRSSDRAAVYELEYTSLDGIRIFGWYAHPRAEVLAPPYPALALLPGYVSEPTMPVTWAERGYAAIGVAPRGKLRSHHNFNPGYPGLLVHNIVDRNTYAYRGFYIDAVRAIDFISGRPEVDPTRVGVHGSSQGGALTVVTAALRPDVIKCGAAGAPYLCGILASAGLTHSYPYEEINEYLRVYPERLDEMERTLSYYDCINLAPRVTAPMFVYLGLQDDVCPPETGMALYESLRGPKELRTYDGCGHDAGDYWAAPLVADFLATHLMPKVGVTA